MASAEDLERIAHSLPGTEARPHFDRTAFRVKKHYATLAPDRLTANLMYSPEEQQFKCMMHPEAFFPVPNKWGEKGATTIVLAKVDEEELTAALELAWTRAGGRWPDA
ncbi:MmcQ/YjbR family DNA-binding protein [Rhizobium sp. L1K21]|uniref:MmcQ/YjbR family DNA-binding protein n=1 Tax=Rhizobium sp. L1K21 TaxID=2954933 RepID=UPI002093428D|nr:MmcQ/YjbR family DNA-binding protein [Rhizobium sp. L1K21]MCO6186600.1 MmcQ/YjbR family DNA-binding protein [Rhizobium sp. L1K21]